MRRYDNNLDKFKNVSDSEKIVLLRGEMIPLIATVKGYAQVIQHKLSEDEQFAECDSSEIQNWLSKIIEAGEDLETLRQLLVDKKERNSFHVFL